MECGSDNTDNQLAVDLTLLLTHKTPTCLFSEKVRVAAVMAHVAVEHIVGHEGKTGPVAEGKRVHSEHGPSGAQHG